MPLPEDASLLTRRQAVARLASGAVLSGSRASWAQAPDPLLSASDDDWHYATLAGMAKRIEAKAISPVELTRRMLDRIAALDGGLHGYVTVMNEQAMASARTAEAEIQAGRYRGPPHGMPIGVKDLCFTKGVPTLAGTLVLRDFVPAFDSTVVARLNAAGAVVLGKLTLCEGAMGPYHQDLQVPVNPWDATRWSGVSSSGSGVATAAGLCFASIGTDTGGSIRYPSAVNGCVGLKPTYGRVSRHGVHALSESMDHLGPMARTVEDTAIMYETMAGFDPKDPTSLSEPVQPVRGGLNQGIKGLRIGFDRRYSTENVEPELVLALDAVLRQLSELGADIVEVRMPDVDKVSAAWWDLATAEAALYHAANFPSRAAEYGPGFRAVLEYGRKVTGVGYAAATRIRAEVVGQVNRMLFDVDCMACPSLSNAAPPKMADPFREETDATWAALVLNDVHTKPFNFSGSPTLSVPCGFSTDGLPFSVQFVGRALSEATLCRVGHTYEMTSPWHGKHPPV